MDMNEDMNERAKKATVRYLELKGYGKIEEVEEEESLLFSLEHSALVSFGVIEFGCIDLWPNADQFKHARFVAEKMGAKNIERIVMMVARHASDRALLRHERDVTKAKEYSGSEANRTPASEDDLKKMIRRLEAIGYHNIRAFFEESYIFAENGRGMIIVSCDKDGEAFGGRASAEKFACDCIPDEFTSGVTLVMMQAIIKDGIIRSYRQVYNR